jgi:ATP-dependent helicase/nuclease subunit A
MSPDWLFRPAPPIPAAPAVLSPSALGGAKALDGETLCSEQAAKLRGTALHLLLEHLPGRDPAIWAEAAQSLIPDPALVPAALAEAKAVLEAPELSALFGPDSLAEVAICGQWQGRQVLGSIDRLIVDPDRVLAIDYKSNAIIPASPDQVPEGAYAHLLAQIYPGRRIETAVLWTRGPSLMPLDPEIVRAALQGTTIP